MANLSPCSIAQRWALQVANREVGQNLADHLAHFTWFGLQTDLPIDPLRDAACALGEESGGGGKSQQENRVTYAGIGV